MKNRTEAYDNIAGKHFTLCVVGGGATGAACALDAQLRGIDTVLLEAADFAGATSSASTKIVHGGVRYLEQAIKSADLQEYHVLVRALHERVRMLENAPHLTRKLDFIVPSYSWIDVAYLDIGLKLYDWLAGPGRISSSKYLSREETIRRMPNVNQSGLIGSVVYADGQFDDARYNIALAQTFTMAGGNALNYARVTGFLRDDQGKICGVVAGEPFSDRVFEVHADCVVNATGPASDSLRQLASPTAKKRMRPSKGAHILLRVEVFPTADALLIPKTEDGRVLFVIPWGGRLLVGTTDEEVSADTELRVTREDVAYLLRHVNQYLEKQATPADIVSGFAGARPLVSGSDSEDGPTKSLARDDVIEVDTSSGLISIMGGKWTTHRAMAEDAINRVQQLLGLADTPSRTHDHVLYGGGGYRDDFWASLCRQHGVGEETARHLAIKFGTAAEHILMIAAEHPDLREPIIAGHPSIRAEIVYCVRYEMAHSIEDVLARRLGIQLYSWRFAIDAAPVVGAVMASELGWATPYRDQAVGEYTHKINVLLNTAGLEPYHSLEQSTCPVRAR
jgi:glycerol-3-phosphate dehydrogenase